MPPRSPEPPTPPDPALEFSAAELSEARRFNRRLLYMPRFRAPNRLSKLAIQSLMRAAQTLTPLAVSGVSIASRRVVWKGQALNLRIITAGGPARGVYLDYHGGGWSIGNAAMDDPVNARIAKDCNLVVVSVDYPLMPEAKLPGIMANCAAAADWAFEHAETEFGAGDLFIGGESAGGHLAACTVLAMKRSRPDFARLKGVVLFYGVYDLSSSPSVRQAPRDALVLHGPSMRGGLGKLAPGRDEAGLRDPEISPLYADLSGLTPALLLCGDIDPLIDDTRLMAARWSEANGNAAAIIAPEAPHAFNRFFTTLAARANARVRGWINARLADAGAAGKVAAE